LFYHISPYGLWDGMEYVCTLRFNLNNEIRIQSPHAYMFNQCYLVNQSYKRKVFVRVNTA
jgi:hypothetical protein